MLLKKLCCGCGVCAVACPEDAIRIEFNDFGEYEANIDLKKCKNCGTCRFVCPENFETYSRLRKEHIKGLKQIPGVEELKGIISKLNILITERTHPAIHALSTFIPRLAIACSIKTHGIFWDIFGENYGNYIIDMSKFTIKELIEKVHHVIRQSS